MCEVTLEKLKLVAGKTSAGKDVFEEVLGEPRSDGNFRVAVTPGLVLGIAADDVISFDGESNTYAVVTRGKNIAVQVYGDADRALAIKDEVGRMGGRHDGGLPNLTVYTIPYPGSFDPVRQLLNELVAGNDSLEWSFGNVYEQNDEAKPLGWWDAE
jgi:Domain of unknown function (DUF4265)